MADSSPKDRPPARHPAHPLEQPGYATLGIDQDAFYRCKFKTLGAADCSFSPLAFLSAPQFKFFWAYANIPAGARVLDFGCGSGMLAALRRKGCLLTGIDLSAEALDIARTVNGYADVYCGNILDYSPPEPFDCIVSLDVFGHIEFDAKDAVIDKMRALLKPGGLMLHAVECGDVDYAAMDAATLRRYVEVDGHIGVEPREAILQRFGHCFEFVEGEVRCHDAMPAAIYAKHAHEYGEALVEPLVADYLETLGPAERLAFDVAAGLTLRAQEAHGLKLASSRGGLCMVRASEAPLPQADYTVPLPPADAFDDQEDDGALFLSGWHDAEGQPGHRLRWSQGQSLLHFGHRHGERFRCSLHTDHPDCRFAPAKLWMQDPRHGDIIWTGGLRRGKRARIEIPIPPSRMVRIVCDRTWSPRLRGQGDDSRLLAFAISHSQLI